MKGQLFSAIVLGLGCMVSAAPLESRSISADLLNTLAFYEQYAAAAYCPQNYNSTGNAITCGGNCPLVQAANAQSLLEFEDSSYGDVTGFLAVDQTNKLIVLSFRGSSSFENWIANLAFDLTDISSCTGCEAHTGFWESWQSVKTSVTASLKTALSTYSSYSIVFTGHSAGAAVAALAALDLRQSGYTIGLYTYGQPRVGNAALSTFMTNQSGGNYRVTHSDDPVPRLPPLLVGYRHLSPEYWITSATDATVTADAVQVITGIASTAGNGGTSGLDVDAHRWYFNNISGCGS